MPFSTGDFFLESDRKARMDIDACLGIVPTAAAAVHKPTGLRTTIIGILGIEDIVNLAQEADSRPLAIGYWQ